MKKLLLCSALLMTSVISADWLDEIVVIVVEKNGFSADKARAVIQKYIDTDKKEIGKLEKQKLENTQEGFLSSVRGGTYEASLAAARLSLQYHERVAHYIKELPKNKKDRKAFEANCKIVDQLQKDLVLLQNKFEKKELFSEKAVVGAKIAAKKVQLEAKKTFMKAFSK